MTFRGKTIFISGASRGIGLAIACRLARDGANIVLAAKTAEPHPKLPGTIFSAAEQVVAAGGKALPIVCDIRDEAAGRRRRSTRAWPRSAASTSASTTRARSPLTDTLVDRHEALRPDEPGQRARHLPLLEASPCRIC